MQDIIHKASGLRVSINGDVFGPRGKLKPWLQNGYRFVKSTKPTLKSWKVSRLVAEAFVENPSSKLEVNHINGIKSDDRACNLEWTTRSENQKHAYDTGLQKPNLGESAGRAKLQASDVLEIRRLYQGGYAQLRLAKLKGVSRENISAIVNNKSWKHI